MTLKLDWSGFPGDIFDVDEYTQDRSVGRASLDLNGKEYDLVVPPLYRWEDMTEGTKTPGAPVTKPLWRPAKRFEKVPLLRGIVFENDYGHFALFVKPEA
jgi:hypothetical protein